MIAQEKLNLQSFVAGFLERAGAVVEAAGPDLVESLLPDELIPYFGEQALLAFDYEAARENPEATFVTYGSPLLDTAARLASDFGRYTVLFAPNTAFNQTRRFDREINEKIEFMRCRPPKAVYQWVADHIFWCFHFYVTYVSHEKIEELMTVVVDGFTGLPSPDFNEWWGKIVPADKSQYQFSQAQGLPLPKLYTTACREAKSSAKKRAILFQQQAGLHITKEMSKVNSYYNRTITDIEYKINATEDKAKKERLLKQMNAAQADWQRREKDILDRYAMEVELRLDHLVACHSPRVHIKLEMQHKDLRLTTTLLYNLLAGYLELPVCPVCSRPTARLTPDRENRLVCPNHS